jgi:hypothetical protein
MVSGAGDVSATPAIGRSVSDSTIHSGFRMVSKSMADAR